MVERGGFEPPKAITDRFTVCSLWPLGHLSYTYALVIANLRVNFGQEVPSGAGDGIRTRDLLITNQLLYLLSYASTN